jgi:hypothetical protein
VQGDAVTPTVAADFTYQHKTAGVLHFKQSHAQQLGIVGEVPNVRLVCVSFGTR